MDDLAPIDGIRHAAILRSPHAHAEILQIDTSRAEALPGVIGVLTGRDVAQLSEPIPNLFGVKAIYFPCALDRVRYYGEPVAVVVAEDRYLAEDALDLIEVKYKALPAVVNPEDALASDSPQLHELARGNVLHERTFRYGDPEAQFASAALTVSIKTHYPRVMSTPMETFGVVAHFESMPDRYTVWSNFQGPFTMYPLMCAALKVGSRGLRHISPQASGGSFGIKQAIYPYIILMAVASRKLRVPVKWIEDRLEHLAASSCASDRVVEMTGAFSAEGILQAVKISQLENTGAYLRPPEPAALYRFHATLNGPYDVRHFSVWNRVVVTNQMPTGLNRGFGGAQYCYPFERLMHRAAVELGIDSLEIRRRNLIRKEKFPYECVSGGVLDSGDYQAAVDLALEKFGWADMKQLRDSARREGRLFGIGTACTVEAGGSNLAYINLALTPEQRQGRLPKSGGSATSTISIDALGAVTVRIDGAPAGQGHETVIAQVVADELGVHPNDVTVVTELDTLRDTWSISSGNYANRFSTTVAGAAALAARSAAGKLKRIAAPLLGAPLESVVLANGKASASGAVNPPVSIRALAAKSHWDTGGLPEGVSAGVAETATMTQPGVDVDAQDRLRSAVTYAFQFDIAAVEIDRESGALHVRKYISIHDAGRLLNPKLADGQIQGGFAHGFGATTSEKVSYAADGTLLSTTFADYLCVTAVEIPALDIGHVSSPSPNTLLGAKGLGDGCAMLTPVVIANAIEDATGVQDLVPPFTASRVWGLLRGADEDRRGESAPAKPQSRTKDGSVRTSGKGKVRVNAAPTDVWQKLFDTRSMQNLLPGCNKLEEVKPDQFRAQITVNIAGMGGAYSCGIEVREKAPPRRAVLVTHAEGQLGFGDGLIEVDIEPEGAGSNLSYKYDAQVGGKAAGIGHRLLDPIVRLMIGEFFERLNDAFAGSTSSMFPRSVFRRVRRLLLTLMGR